MHSLDQIRQRLDDDGYVIVQRLFAMEHVKAARAELAALATSHGAALRELGRTPPESDGRPLETALLDLYGDDLEWCPTWYPQLFHRPALAPIAMNESILAWTGELLRAPLAFDPDRAVMARLPGRARPLPHWVQSAAEIHAARGAGATDLRAVCVWAPLVPSRPENGGLRVVAQSHKNGLLSHLRNGNAYALPDNHAAIDYDRTVDCIADPGDVVLFNPFTVRTWPRNLTRTILWSALWCLHDATSLTEREASAVRVDDVHDAAAWAAAAPAVREPADPVTIG